MFHLHQVTLSTRPPDLIDFNTTTNNRQMPFATYTLSALRLLTGSTLLLFPRSIFRLARIPQPSASSGVLALRFAGAREFAVGALLWRALSEAQTSDRKLDEYVNGAAESPLLNRASTSGGAKDANTKMVKDVLVAGMLVDAVDIGICAACVLEGSLAWQPAAGIAALGIVAVGLGAYCLRDADASRRGSEGD